MKFILSYGSEVNEKHLFLFPAVKLTPLFLNKFHRQTQLSSMLLCYLYQDSALLWCKWTMMNIVHIRDGACLFGGEKSLPLSSFLVGRCISIHLKFTDQSTMQRGKFVFPRKQVDTAYNLGKCR
jgi:hypothetical protein